MVLASKLTRTNALSEMLLYKALEPLAEHHCIEIERIQKLDVSAYTEADVREEIISPLLRILGYSKETYFSLEREKPIQFLKNKRFIDYNITLWSQNFWLIEAKKPRMTRGVWPANDFSQAIGYAAHPEINAALVVLCDGNTITVFDRETDQVNPLLDINVNALASQVDDLRAILGPWQSWFFEKRRITRLIDKVFDQESNLSRVAEFQKIVLDQLDRKRGIVIKNLQSRPKQKDDLTSDLKRATLDELVTYHFFVPQSGLRTHAIAEAMVRHCRERDFDALFKVFPDTPRDINDYYCANALNFLLHLKKSRAEVNWLPSWLGGRGSVDAAIKRYIELCLTHFRDEPVQRNILLLASTFRRVSKAAMVSIERIWQTGELRHALFRYIAPEDSLSQFSSSPATHNLNELDRMTMIGVPKLIRACSDDQQKPKEMLLAKCLTDLWKLEAGIVKGETHYHQLLTERNLGELHPTERIDVSVDFLGHMALCMIDQFEEWKVYVLSQHSSELDALAKLGSWKAREWLGKDISEDLGSVSEIDIAARFFIDDVEALRRLSDLY